MLFRSQWYEVRVSPTRREEQHHFDVSPSLIALCCEWMWISGSAIERIDHERCFLLVALLDVNDFSACLLADFLLNYLPTSICAYLLVVNHHYVSMVARYRSRVGSTGINWHPRTDEGCQIRLAHFVRISPQIPAFSGIHKSIGGYSCSKSLVIG